MCFGTDRNSRPFTLMRMFALVFESKMSSRDQLCACSRSSLQRSSVPVLHINMHDSAGQDLPTRSNRESVILLISPRKTSTERRPEHLFIRHPSSRSHCLSAETGTIPRLLFRSPDSQEAAAQLQTSSMMIFFFFTFSQARLRPSESSRRLGRWRSRPPSVRGLGVPNRRAAGC